MVTWSMPLVGYRVLIAPPNAPEREKESKHRKINFLIADFRLKNELAPGPGAEVRRGSRTFVGASVAAQGSASTLPEAPGGSRKLPEAPGGSRKLPEVPQGVCALGNAQGRTLGRTRGRSLGSAQKHARRALGSALGRAQGIGVAPRLARSCGSPQGAWGG